MSVCGLDVGQFAKITTTDIEVIKMKKEKKQSKLGIIIGGVALTAAGLIIVPPLIEKYSNKMYKASIKNDPIDFDNLGPEIVPTEKKEEVIE